MLTAKEARELMEETTDRKLCTIGEYIEFAAKRKEFSVAVLAKEYIDIKGPLETLGFKVSLVDPLSANTSMVIDWSNPVPPKPEPPPIRILKEGEVRKKCQTVYRVFVTNDAAKQIDHLPTSLRQLIKKRIDGLQNGDIQNSIGLPSTGDRSELRVFRVALGLHLLASIDKEEGVVAVVSVRNREDQWAHTEEYESLEDNKIGPLVGGIFLGFGIVAFFAIIFLLLH